MAMISCAPGMRKCPQTMAAITGMVPRTHTSPRGGPSVHVFVETNEGSRKNNWDARVRTLTSTNPSLDRRKQGAAHACPASRLPHDIVLEIFQHYHEQGTPIRLPFIKDRPAGPFVFSHVCQDWRVAAATLSGAWSSIHIEVPQNITTVAADRVHSLLSLCTKNSAKRPLDIRLSVYARTTSGRSEIDYGSLSPISLHHIFSAMFSQIQRWRKICVEAPCLALEELLAYTHINATHSTPFLESFYLQGDSVSNMSRSAISDEPFFDGRSAPSLRTLSLCEDALFWADKKAFPWSQLEELNLRGTYLGLTLQECVEILQGCESLRRCQLSICGTGRAIASPEPVVLGALEKLVIVDHNLPVQRRDIYRAISCPRLEELTVKYTEGIGCSDDPDRLVWAGEALAALLEESTGIQRLHLCAAPLTERGLIRVLQRHPTISHLSVSNGELDTLFGNQALFELTISPGRVLLPKLERIYIESSRCSGHYVEEFVESRRKSCETVKLKYLHFDSLGLELEPSLRVRLKEACGEGLALTLDKVTE